MKRAGLLSILMLAAAAAGASAQDAVREGQKAVGLKMADPSLSSPAGGPGFDVLLTTERKDAKGKAKLGFWLGRDFFFDLKFIVPMGESDSEVEPVRLDGLAKSSVVDLGFHYLSWSPKIDAGKAKAVQDEYLERNPGTRNFILTLQNLKSEPDLQKRFLEAVSWGTGYHAVLRAKIGRQDFSYSDANLDEFKTQKTNLAFEAAAGVLFPEAGYVGFSYEFQRYHEAGASVEIIAPFKDTSFFQMRKTSLGAPSRRSQNKMQIEYRVGLGSWGAINPKVSYYFKTQAALIEFPVYIFKGPEEGLNGGINLTWSSRGEGRFGLALFIGAGFALFPD